MFNLNLILRLNLLLKLEILLKLKVKFSLLIHALPRTSLVRCEGGLVVGHLHRVVVASVHGAQDLV